jgi:hypothetical protein
MTTENQNTEPTFNPSNGRFNRAAIKRHFKLVSEVTRAGKFTRVSEDAINRAEAAAETRIRSMLNQTANSPVGGTVKRVENTFLTGEGKERVLEAFNNAFAAEIQRIVNDTRTGHTI